MQYLYKITSLLLTCNGSTAEKTTQSHSPVTATDLNIRNMEEEEENFNVYPFHYTQAPELQITNKKNKTQRGKEVQREESEGF